MIKIRLHWLMAALLLLTPVTGYSQTQNSPLELSTLR